MNTKQHKVDASNEPFDSIDAALTTALWVLAGVAVGMFITAALMYFGRVA